MHFKKKVDYACSHNSTRFIFQSRKMQKRCEMLTSARAQVNGLMSLNRKLGTMSSGRAADEHIAGFWLG